MASRPGAWAAFTLDTRTTGTNPSLLSSQLPAGNASAFVPRNSNLTDLATKPVFAAKLGLANLLVSGAVVAVPEAEVSGLAPWALG